MIALLRRLQAPRWQKRLALAGLVALVAGLVLLAGSAYAQQVPPGGGAPAPRPAAAPQDPQSFALSKPLVSMIALGALSLAPFILTMTTSFLKFSVIGSILRSALGTQQIPPNQVLMGLSLILTIYVMAPTATKIHTEIGSLMDKASEKGVMSDQGIEIIKQAIERGKKPYLEFLHRHSHAKDRQLFVSMARALRKGDPEAEDLTERDALCLIPAFVTSELTEAFQIGFILFVPFIVIDMIVSNVLLAMGMQMLSPTIISLPCKLLLFVLVDGWHLIMKGLVLGYA
ncbi:MAG TPA: type III secretion system export apparatus subunit SctR [Planctomycetota bacterium]|nr:type III secretion system export apparatus subunit SctR [Planctomycetota bacterium]